MPSSYSRNIEPLVGKAVTRYNVAKNNMVSDALGNYNMYQVVYLFADVNTDVGSWIEFNASISEKSSGNYIFCFEKHEGKYVFVRDMTTSPAKLDI